MRQMRFKLYVYISILCLTGCASNHQKLLYNKKPAFYSYIIGNIENGHINLEHESDAYSTPASCQKVITALLAYKMLGSNYFYETKLYAKKKNRRVQDLIIHFSGDPTLKSEDLITLLQPVKGRSILGNIILDASFFRTNPHSPNIMTGDVGTSYGQPVSSMIIDQNLIIVTAEPKEFGKIHIKNDSGYFIDSAVTTTTSPSSIKLAWSGQHIMVKGGMNFKDSPLEFKLSPREIDNYILYKVKVAMKALNIRGKVKITHNRAQLSEDFSLINNVSSKPLEHIIPPALKKSDNLVFDSLYLTIANSQNPDGIEEWSQGNNIMKGLIQKYFDVNVENAVLVDGSGLSRYNRIQARKLLQILKRGHSMKEFVNALPAPREANSTLEKRDILSKSIRAKTGNMSGISCLCGYNMGPYPKAFVIMVNSFSAPQQEIISVMDRFISYHLR